MTLEMYSNLKTVDLGMEKHVSMRLLGSNYILEGCDFRYEFSVALVKEIAHRWCPGHIEILNKVDRTQIDIKVLKTEIEMLEENHQRTSAKKSTEVATFTLKLDAERSKNNKIVTTYNDTEEYLMLKKNIYSTLITQKEGIEVENKGTLATFGQLKSQCEKKQLKNDQLSADIVAKKLELQNKQTEELEQEKQICGSSQKSVPRFM